MTEQEELLKELKAIRKGQENGFVVPIQMIDAELKDFKEHFTKVMKDIKQRLEALENAMP